jgi:hypothetical protein
MPVNAYTIYLVNRSSRTQIFSCFLQRPAELADRPSVFDVTNLSLGVRSSSGGSDYFVIPQQLVVAVGASNQPVGANAQIVSNRTLNADPGDQFSADYVNVPPSMGPTLTQSGTSAAPGQISISANAFNQPSNEAQGWFANMSFGVQTGSGFMGMTWSPSPNQTNDLTPVWGFFVTAKAYYSNYLVTFATGSNTSAQLTAPKDFLYDAATVTYTATGGWQVTPGKPQAGPQLVRASTDSLADAHRSLTQAHSDLIALVGAPGPDRSR